MTLVTQKSGQPTRMTVSSSTGWAIKQIWISFGQRCKQTNRTDQRATASTFSYQLYFSVYIISSQAEPFQQQPDEIAPLITINQLCLPLLLTRGIASKLAITTTSSSLWQFLSACNLDQQVFVHNLERLKYFYNNLASSLKLYASVIDRPEAHFVGGNRWCRLQVVASTNRTTRTKFETVL